jgi:uncharacterized membrane protein YoaK (UPF0700 family)
MTKMTNLIVPVLLTFNGGFVDTAGFLGLQGLFTAHVTGNFVTLAATLVMGTHGVIAKIVGAPRIRDRCGIRACSWVGHESTGIAGFANLAYDKSLLFASILYSCRSLRALS